MRPVRIVLNVWAEFQENVRLADNTTISNTKVNLEAPTSSVVLEKM